MSSAKRQRPMHGQQWQALGDQRAFTLIELMVVVLVISILVSMAVVVYHIARDSTCRRACQSNLRILYQAVQTYHNAEDTWPSGLSVLVPDYVTKEPMCPVENAHYVYNNSTHEFSCPNNGQVVNGINASGHRLP